MLKSEIRTENGLSTIYVDGKPVWPMSFCSRHNDDPVYTRNLQDAGIRLFWAFCDTDWQRAGAFDELQEKCGLILAGAPEALIMVRVSLNPPKQWIIDNPGECITFENGKTSLYDPCNKEYPGSSVVREEYTGVGDYSMASSKWTDDAITALDEFIDRIESSFFGRRVMGYFLNAGGTEEWYYNKTFDRSKHAMGYSEAFRRAFELFLRGKYGNDLKMLRRAWRDDRVTFEKPYVPSLDERSLSRALREHAIEHADNRADFGSFLDPVKSRRIADFYEAWNHATGMNLRKVARFIKAKTDDKALVGAFYGCMGCVLYHDFGTSKASLALDCPDVDFLSAPTNYEDRILGGGAGFTNPVDSMHLHGKCWINEDDVGTSLQSRGRWVSCCQTTDIREDIEIMKRDFSRNLCVDAYSWWFENSCEDSWWNHPDFFRIMKRMQETMKDYYASPRRKNSRICCLYDEESIWYTDNETLKDIMQMVRILEIPRIGAPADEYFLEDVVMDTFPAHSYKVYLIFNATYVNDAKRRAIRTKLCRNGNAVIWVYQTGFMHPGVTEQVSMEWARDLTGIEIDYRDITHDLTWLLTNDRHPYTKGMSELQIWGRYRRPIFNGFYWNLGKVMIMHPSLGRPLFYSRDREGEVLGRFIGNNEPALAVKEMGDWTSIFVGSKVLPSDFIRNVARKHGVHIYNEANDVFYANADFVAIHPSEEGYRTITLPTKARRVVEVFDGEVVAENTNTFTLELPFNVTKLYRTEW